MKFLVDTLPYYGDYCPFSTQSDASACCFASDSECPRYWNKEKVCSNENPHECELLREVNISFKED